MGERGLWSGSRMGAGRKEFGWEPEALMSHGALKRAVCRELIGDECWGGGG